MREQTPTLTPTLSLSEGEGAVSIPSPPEGEGQSEGAPATRSALFMPGVNARAMEKVIENLHVDHARRVLALADAIAAARMMMGA